MIERGELAQVNANTELADRLLLTASQHLASARLLAASDPYLAYAAVYDAIRKSLSALLQAQGLRATTKGGHLAVMHATYIDEDAVLEDLPKAEAVVEAAAKAMPHLTAFAV